MTEREIVHGCIEQDRRCQNALYKNYFPLMSSIALRYFDNRDDALEAINYGFLKILNSIELYKADFALATWIRNILVNHIIDEFRRSKRYVNQTHLTDFSDNNEPVSVNLAEEKWAEEDLRFMLSVLPETTRNVFNLYAIDGFKHREISEMLGISENTSKWHVREARIKLKQLMEKKLEPIGIPKSGR